jgi:endonuclease I
MKVFLLSLVLLFYFQISYGEIPPGYYNGAAELSGDALKDALNNIIDGHTELSYDDVKDALRETDEDPNNTSNVICLYTGWSYGKDAFDTGSEGWNREHVWSKSHGDFGTVAPAGTDIHHLRPADESVNSSKGNRDFDWGVEEYIDGSGATGCYKDDDIWEPRDSEKGDVARMIFYMATRYEGENSEVDLEIVDYVNTAGSTNEPFYGKLTTLLQWHQSDSVDSWEINRNNIIYTTYQHNRNPYIDHPEYVNLIWGGTINPEPSNHATLFTTGSITSTAISLSWNDNDGTNPADKFLIMINTTGTFTSPIDGIENNNDTDISDGVGQIKIIHGIEAYTFTGLDATTLYYFEIYPFSNFGIDTDYKTDGSIPDASASTSVTGPINLSLIISEVADPDDVYQSRFVEIYNAGNIAIDFSSDIWYLCRQANGSSTSWGNILLTGSVNAGETYAVTYNSSYFLGSYGFDADLSNGNISGNGNDGYFLYYGDNYTSGTLVDAYGVIDEDGTGKEWDYLDSKAVRKYLDTIPSQTWQAEQWVISLQANTDDMTPNWHRITLDWTGTQSQAWENKDNWTDNGSTSNYKPDAGSKVIIPFATSSPIITSDASCGIIKLETDATLTISTGKLIVGH